jgi:predicted nucleotidyltransferase
VVWQTIARNEDTIVATLHRHQRDLQGLGVESLALFGSMARGDGDAASGIDLAVTYGEAVVKDLLDMGGG